MSRYFLFNPGRFLLRGDVLYCKKLKKLSRRRGAGGGRRKRRRRRKVYSRLTQ